MTAYLIIFLLFLLQFVYLPIGTSFFEGTKVYTAEFAILFLLCIRLASKNNLLYHIHRKYFLWCLAIVCIVSLYHLFFSRTATILFGNAVRMQGTLLLWCLSLFSILSGQEAIDKKINRIFVAGVIAVQFICSLLIVGAGAERAIGTMGEPNALAADTVFLWPFLFFPKPKSWRQWVIAVVCLLLVGTIILITGSRSGLVAFGIQMIFLLFVYLFHRRLLIPAIIGVSLMLLSLIAPFYAHDIYENRGEIWVSALHAGFAHPILGVGFGNTEYALHAANVQLHNHLPGYYVDSSHNIFLDWFVQGGTIGLGVFLFLLFQTFARFVQQRKIRNLVLLLGLLTALSFNPASVVSLIALWWLIGQGNL